MKLHLIATVLLAVAVAAPDAVSAKKVSSCSSSPADLISLVSFRSSCSNVVRFSCFMPKIIYVSQLRGPEVALAECPDDQISCDISSDPDCRSSRDKTSRGCKKTWTKGCCTRDCKPDGKGGRVCRIAPPSEDYFGFFGFADVEDYYGDEDSEEFDSEDLAAENFADSEDDVDFDSEDEDSEDMIFNYSGRCTTRRNRNASCCDDEFFECKDDKRDGFRTPNCARQKQQCYNNLFLAVEVA
eukprot:scaffold10125_cov108-Skeletonema_dohrnii-CCMP3373.AAC.2